MADCHSPRPVKAEPFLVVLGHRVGDDHVVTAIQFESCEAALATAEAASDRCHFGAEVWCGHRMIFDSRQPLAFVSPDEVDRMRPRAPGRYMVQADLQSEVVTYHLVR